MSLSATTEVLSELGHVMPTPGELENVVRQRRGSFSQVPFPVLLRALAESRVWKAPRFPLKGRDLLAIGVPHGPEVGERLARVEAWWIEQDFRPTRAECLEKAKAPEG